MVVKRKYESFRRIKCSTLNKLLTENNFAESIYKLGKDDSDEEIKDVSQLLIFEKTESISAHVGNESVYSMHTNITVQSSATAMSAVTVATE